MYVRVITFVYVVSCVEWECHPSVGQSVCPSVIVGTPKPTRTLQFPDRRCQPATHRHPHWAKKRPSRRGTAPLPSSATPPGANKPARTIHPTAQQRFCASKSTNITVEGIGFTSQVTHHNPSVICMSNNQQRRRKRCHPRKASSIPVSSSCSSPCFHIRCTSTNTSTMTPPPQQQQNDNRSAAVGVASRRHQQQQWRRTALFLVASLCWYQHVSSPSCSCSSSASIHVDAFRISMEYRPPVKSSVRKLGGLDSRGYLASTPSGGSSSSSSAASGGNRDVQRAAHALSYHGAAASPATTARSPVRQSFERRMRNLVLGNPQPPQTNHHAPTENALLSPSRTTMPRVALPPNVRTVHSLSDYKALVGDERNKMVVVRFYADWCRVSFRAPSVRLSFWVVHALSIFKNSLFKFSFSFCCAPSLQACKAVAPLFYRMAHHHPDVSFVEVPVTERNAALHQGLGVPSLPFAHVYHPHSGLVEETRFTRKDVATLQTKLNCYLQGYCDLSDETVWVPSPVSSEDLPGP